MNRRILFKTTGLAAVSAFLPFSNSFSTTPSRPYINPGFYQFTVGNLPLTIVTDGHGLFSPAQPVFAPGADPKEIERLLSENFLPKGSVDVAFNVMVIRQGKGIIIIDSGCGHNFGTGAGKLVNNLKSIGITPADVTAVVLTHAHPDHIGGLVSESGTPVFENAKIHVAQKELDFWMADNPDFSGSKFTDKQAINGWIALAKKTFTTYKSKLQTFKDSEVLYDCIRTRIVPGHTPGHTLITIFSADEKLVHMGDTAHDHTILFAHPEWGVALDTDFEQAAAARKTILTELSATKSFVFSTHLPWPGLGHVRKKSSGFEWVEHAIATPQV